MNTEETDISFGSMRLTGGGDDNFTDMLAQAEISEGAVGYSRNLNQWSEYVYNEINDPCFHNEENEVFDHEHEVPLGNSGLLYERQRHSSNPQPYGRDVLLARDRELFCERRHSSGETLLRRRSMPVLSDVIGINQHMPVARQESSQSIPRIRSETGMRRRGSVQVVSSGRQDDVRFRRNSIQVDRPLQVGEQSLMPSNLLSPNHNHFAHVNAPNEIARVGSDLFLMFLREEIERCHLQPPQCLIPQDDLPQSSRDSLEDSEFVEMGTHLRHMADEFAQSDQRERVRERADNVNLNSLDFNSFSDLLFGTFQQGGVTCERVLVLFTFCTDLAVRALREKLQARFHELTQWSQQYIMAWLSPWVQHHGGWAVVLECSVNQVYKVAVIGVCFMGMIAFWVYIRNNCR